MGPANPHVLFYIKTDPIGPNEFVVKSQLSGHWLKEAFQVTLVAGESIGEFKTVIGGDTRHGNASAGKVRSDLA